MSGEARERRRRASRWHRGDGWDIGYARSSAPTRPATSPGGAHGGWRRHPHHPSRTALRRRAAQITWGEHEDPSHLHGPDNQSHFEELEIPWCAAYGGSRSGCRPQGDLPRDAGRRCARFHRAPRRQFVVTLSGIGEIECGDAPDDASAGDILLAETLQGKAHHSRNPGATARISFPCLRTLTFGPGRHSKSAQCPKGWRCTDGDGPRATTC